MDRATVFVVLSREHLSSAPIAQWIEHLSSEQSVGGSNPSGCAREPALMAGSFFALQNYNTISRTGCGHTQKLVLKVDNRIQVGSAMTDVTGAISATIPIPDRLSTSPLLAA